MRMVQFHQFPSFLSFTLMLFLSLLINDAGIVHEKFVIVEFFDNELFLKLIVRIEEELTTHEEKSIGNYVQKFLHCGQSDSLSFVRHNQQHSLEESRSHEPICELNDLPLSDLLILFVHILSPQNFEKLQEGQTNQWLELLEDHVQEGHDFRISKYLLIDAAFLALRVVDFIFLDGLKCLLKWVNFLRRLVDVLVIRLTFALSLEQSHMIPYIFLEDELMFLHETHLEVFISPPHLCLLNFSLFLCCLWSAIAYLRLQMIFNHLRFLGPKREVFLVKTEKVIAVTVQVSHLMQIVIAHCPSF